MEHYVAGWDGGGTKTAMQILDLDGNCILECQSGALNYNSQSRQEICDTMNTLFQRMDLLPGKRNGCSTLCIATAGVSNKEAITFLQGYVRSQGILCDIAVIGDYEAALYGAFEKPEGIVLVSGTGSICYGRRGETGARTGGYGHLIDDEGSGYAIGRDILSAAVRIYDGRNSDSILLDLVLERMEGTTVEDIIAYTYQPNWNKKMIASLSPILLKAMEKKDRTASQICQKAADNLAQLVLPVAGKLGLKDSNIAFLGGILEHYEPIKERVLQRLQQELPLLQIINPKRNSVAGAALNALDSYRQKEANNNVGYVG